MIESSLDPVHHDLLRRYEKKNTKECPHCYSEIDTRATVCPNCQKPIKKNNRKFWLIFAIVVVCSCFAIIFSNGDNSGNSGSGNTSNSSPTRTSRPASTMAPVILRGSGDSVVDISKTDDPAIAEISFRGTGNFAVWNYDISGERIDLLVNTIGNYSGIVPIDFLSDEHTGRFEVESDGSWTIEVRSLSTARSVSVPGSISGNGDDVILLTGRSPDTADISNQGEGNFAVWSFGNRRDLLVNEIGSYSGRVIIDSDTIVLVISSEGSWSVSITAR